MRLRNKIGFKAVSYLIQLALTGMVLALSLPAYCAEDKTGIPVDGNNNTAAEIEKIMREKARYFKKGEAVTAKAVKIKDPLESPFDLYQVDFTNQGRPMGSITVSVIEKSGKTFLINGGSVWDMTKGIEMQSLWSSLTKTAEIPYTEERLIAGKNGCKIPVSVFSDYQCFHCKRFIPTITDMVSKNEDMCLYLFQMPLTGLHKTAKYVSQMALAYEQLAKEKVPDAIYQRNFKDAEENINEFFEDLIALKGIDTATFYKKVSSPEIASRIEEDLQLSKTLNLRGTPSVFIDGHTVMAAVEKVQEMLTYLRVLSDEKKMASMETK